MDKQKVSKRINNLKKVQAIVEIAKFDTLQKLANAQKVSNHHYEASDIAKQAMIYANNKLKLSHSIKGNKKNNKNLFIYITIPSKVIKVSYKNTNDLLKSKFNPQLDEILCVGSPAIELANRREYQIVKQYDALENTAENVISLINNSIKEYKYTSIHIVAHTDHLKDDSFQIFPLDGKGDKKRFSKTKFYYSLTEIFSTIASTYVENIVKGVYQEAYKTFYKEKLIRHEGSIKSIDDRMERLKLDLIKVNRKKETEDMILVSQISKRTK